MTPLDTIAEGERLLAAWLRNYKDLSVPVKVASFSRCDAEAWLLDHAPALLAVARAAAEFSRTLEGINSRWNDAGNPAGIYESSALHAASEASLQFAAALDRLKEDYDA